eukprot:m.224201 g.224201  ORF g.224201 m.224201 type:complete len:656 (-) comp11058_c0_seq1:70-2037(-)
MALDTLDWTVLSVAALAVAYVIKRRLSAAPTGRPAVPPPAAAAPKATPGENERNFVEKMKKSDKNCIIFFGSQTGTAEEYAGRLVKEARRYSFKAMAADMKDYDAQYLADVGTIPDALVLFCLATYGEGEPTDNARDFHDWLKEAEGSQSADLSALRFSVFGLGNKTYEQFNYVGKFFDGALAKLGANRVYPRGDGDDDANLEDDFNAWKDAMWSAVCVAFNVQAGDDASFRQYAMKFRPDVPVEKVFTGEISTLNAYAQQKRPFNMQNPYLATVLVNRELYSDNERSCRHIELDISAAGIRYAAGDHVAVYPSNNAMLVQRLAVRLGLDLDAVFSLDAVDETAKKRHPFPCPCTLATALQHYVDISGRPSAYVVRELLPFTSDSAEKEKLQSVVKDPAKYHEWVVESERNIVDILEDMPSVAPPVDYLLELLPRLQPRYYSISSSPKAHNTAIHITAAVVRHTARSGRQFNGVATTYLLDQQPGARVPIFVRQSSFRLPVDTKVPVIMVGPGTGLAPFRGFVQERLHAKSAGKPIGDTMLFFGCQRSEHHYLYRDELHGAKEAGALTHLTVAASRDQASKVYVQHHLRDHGEQVCQLLKRGAYVYVCGDAKKMAHDVHVALEEILVQHDSKTREQAADFLKTLRTKRRYQQDVW